MLSAEPSKLLFIYFLRGRSRLWLLVSEDMYAERGCVKYRVKKGYEVQVKIIIEQRCPKRIIPHACFDKEVKEIVEKYTDKRVEGCPD